MNPKALEHLAQGLIHLGLDQKSGLSAALDRYAEFLLRTYQGLNLVAPMSDEDFVAKHLLDSLAPWREFKPGASVADIGSGGGLPGIPLSLVLEGPVTLIESKAKKARFLEDAVQTLSLSRTSVLCRNAMEVRDSFDIITCRAFSDMAHTIKITRHLLTRGGVYLFYKGRRQSIEEETTQIQGFRLEILPLQIPGLDAERHLVKCRPS